MGQDSSEALAVCIAFGMASLVAARRLGAILLFIVLVSIGDVGLREDIFHQQ